VLEVVVPAVWTLQTGDLVSSDRELVAASGPTLHATILLGERLDERIFVLIREMSQSLLFQLRRRRCHEYSFTESAVLLEHGRGYGPGI